MKPDQFDLFEPPRSPYTDGWLPGDRAMIVWLNGRRDKPLYALEARVVAREGEVITVECAATTPPRFTMPASGFSPPEWEPRIWLEGMAGLTMAQIAGEVA